MLQNLVLILVLFRLVLAGLVVVILTEGLGVLLALGCSLLGGVGVETILELFAQLGVALVGVLVPVPS